MNFLTKKIKDERQSYLDDWQSWIPFKLSIAFKTSSLDLWSDEPVKAILSNNKLTPLGYETSYLEPAFTKTVFEICKYMCKSLTLT